MVLVRTMRHDDVEDAGRVLGACYRWLGARGEYSPAQVDALVERRAAPAGLRRRSPDELRLVALLDSELVGLASACGDELTRLYVDPHHHGEGIGSALLLEAERRLARAGRSHLVLGTTLTAMPFYLARGMFLTEERAHALPGFEERRVLLMRKELGDAPRPYVRLQVRYCGKLAKPVGVFGACYHLRRAGRLSCADDRIFREVDDWFIAHLPEPPFYHDGNSRRAITWFKRSATEMLARAQPLIDLLRRHDVLCDRVEAGVPGAVIYEDAWQVGVV